MNAKLKKLKALHEQSITTIAELERLENFLPSLAQDEREKAYDEQMKRIADSHEALFLFFEEMGLITVCNDEAIEAINELDKTLQTTDL